MMLVVWQPRSVAAVVVVGDISRATHCLQNPATELPEVVSCSLRWSFRGFLHSATEEQKIVGDDDGGVLFTPEQYAEYKRRVLPQRVNNRLYVSFGMPGGIDCKLIGPETQCFCTHRYKQHKTDFEVIPSERPLALPCQVRGCHCPAYQYIPRIGPNPVRCRCKHLPQDHSEATGHMCKKCSSCSGFQSPYSCGCGQPTSAHQTLVETKQERETRGRPIGRDVPYAAMGGLTGFSSLLDGYLALEASTSDQDIKDGCQQRGSAAMIKEVSSKTSSSYSRYESNK